MSEAEHTREFRLRPRRPRPDRSNDKVPGGFLRLMQLFRATAKQAGGGSARRSGRPPKLASHRCAVRVSYLPNKAKGQWRAHGRDLERDSAIGENRPFGKESAQAGLSERLGEWQSSRDPRLFKLILSPEFGERLDLRQFTRDFMGGLDRHGVIAKGTPEQVETEVKKVLKGAPKQFILAADCTVAGETDWKRLRQVIDVAHGAKRA